MNNRLHIINHSLTMYEHEGPSPVRHGGDVVIKHVI